MQLRVTGAEMAPAPHTCPHTLSHLAIPGLTLHSQKGSITSYFHIHKALAPFTQEGYKAVSMVTVEVGGAN